MKANWKPLGLVALAAVLGLERGATADNSPPGSSPSKVATAQEPKAPVNWVKIDCKVKVGKYVIENPSRYPIPSNTQFRFTDEQGAHAFIVGDLGNFPHGQQRSIAPQSPSAGCTASFDGGKHELEVGDVRWANGRKTAIARVANVNYFLPVSHVVVRFRSSNGCDKAHMNATADSHPIELLPMEMRDVFVDLSSDLKPHLEAIVDPDNRIPELVESNNKSYSQNYPESCK